MLDIDRWSLLALARFVLATIVAINHLAEYTQLGALSFIPKLGAFEAVLGFLLISGYSVTSSYLTKERGFLQRRLLRLYPVYFASIVITVAVAALVQQASLPSIATLLANGLFLNQLTTQTSLVGPAWSLSLEFWLYLLLPGFLRLSTQRNRLIVYASFSAYLIYTGLRTLLHLPYYSGLGYGANLVLLAFAWIVGSRLARPDDDRRQTLRDLQIVLTGHLFVAAAIQFGYRFKHHAADQFLAADLASIALQALTLFGVYVLLAHVTREARSPRRSSRVMQLAGDISYPLYLIHIPVYIAVSRVEVESPYLLFGAAVGLSWVVYSVVDFYSRRRVA